MPATGRSRRSRSTPGRGGSSRSPTPWGSRSPPWPTTMRWGATSPPRPRTAPVASGSTPPRTSARGGRVGPRAGRRDRRRCGHGSAAATRSSPGTTPGRRSRKPVGSSGAVPPCPPGGCASVVASLAGMELRTLGRTGVKVSPLCLGAMMFGVWGNPDHEDSIRIIHAALDAGINFVDTADVYGRGESEEIVGKALRGRRDQVVLATKVHGTMGDDPNQFGNSRRWIVREVEDSLRRLGTDWIDLYQIHRPEPDTDIDETLGALSDLVHAGKVRYIGSST